MEKNNSLLIKLFEGLVEKAISVVNVEKIQIDQDAGCNHFVAHIGVSSETLNQIRMTIYLRSYNDPVFDVTDEVREAMGKLCEQGISTGIGYSQ